MPTIRNCPLGRECPGLWDRLTPDADPAAWHCPRCDRRVYLCVTDGETVAHVRAGHRVARESPTDAELGSEYVGMFPLAWGPPTPEQAAARARRAREQAIDDALRNAHESSRDCPECGYPVPDRRVACRVCGCATGRAYDADGNLRWGGLE